MLLILLCTGAVAVYSPGLNGPFVFDDYHNIVRNPLVAIDALDAPRLRDAAFSHGDVTYPHRGLARVTFALNYHFAGRRFDALAFKLTNVAIHVVNGLLVYWLSVLLLRRRAMLAPPPVAGAWDTQRSYLPLLITALWLLHPIQLTGVLYVVQRMTSMAALFVLLGLVVFVIGRNRLDSGRRHGLTLMIAALAGGSGLGFLCKQNAVLLPCFAFLVELFFFRAGELPEAARRRLYGLYAVTVALPAVIAMAGLVIAWDAIAGGYVHRDFSPWERLLTESRVLFFYLGLLLFPHIRAFSLYHDDLALSTGLLDPWTTLASLLAWAVLAALAVWGVRRRAIWSFGLLWYLLGHSMESSILGLELVFEHRNYLPSYGFFFAAAYYLVAALRRMAGTRRLTVPVAVLAVAVLAFTTYARAGIWGDSYTLKAFTAKNHPASYRSLAGAGILSILGRSDVREVYVAYGRVAEARASTVIPLVEMAKIAVGLRGLIADRDGAQGEGPVSPDDDLLRREPILSVPYLNAAETRIDREIRHRLQAYPVSYESASSLDSLRDCIVKRIDVCIPLAERLGEWYDIALDNPARPDVVSGMLNVHRGQYHEYLGELDLAAARMRDAIAADPDNLSHGLTLARFYIRHELWPEADRVLDVLEGNRPWSGFGSRHVSWLREQYEIRRQANGVDPQ